MKLHGLSTDDNTVQCMSECNSSGINPRKLQHPLRNAIDILFLKKKKFLNRKNKERNKMNKQMEKKNKLKKRKLRRIYN